MTETEKQAVRVAARVPATVGFDPMTVIAIITQVLPMILSCFNRNDETDPAKIAAAVKRQNESAPAVLRRRTARRIRGEATEKMSKEQSFTLAEAVIEEAIAANESDVVSMCHEVNNVSVPSEAVG
jgi:hypothetical protein